MNDPDLAYALKRIGLGLLAMFGVLAVADFIPSLFGTMWQLGSFDFFTPVPVGWVLIIASAALVGAYVARVSFAAAAAILTTLVGLLALRVLQTLVEPVESIAYVDILARNALGLGISVLGSVVGAEIGRKLLQTKTEMVA